MSSLKLKGRLKKKKSRDNTFLSKVRTRGKKVKPSPGSDNDCFQTSRVMERLGLEREIKERLFQKSRVSPLFKKNQNV